MISIKDKFICYATKDDASKVGLHRYFNPKRSDESLERNISCLIENHNEFRYIYIQGIGKQRLIKIAERIRDRLNVAELIENSPNVIELFKWRRSA